MEYNVVLDLGASVEIFQYPLHDTLPDIEEVKTKDKGKYVEAKANTEMGETCLRGVSSDCINEYYVLTVGEGTVLGEKVENILQLRPVLPDTPDTLSKTQKKESMRIFSISESHEEVLSRAKNPNYIMEKLAKEPWKKYSVSAPFPVFQNTLRIPSLQSIHEHVSESAKSSKSAKESGKEAEGALDAVMTEIKRTIYNARVTNLSTLQDMFPRAPHSLLAQALNELTFPVLGRYVIKPEFFKDMSGIFLSIIGRMQSSEGALVLSFKELSDPEETFMYVLAQVSHKEGHLYKLKGYNELGV
ncbi:hypothetical protein NECID01_1444 [Nematocida sp. AWRm77]|nr:hypothetical protein NECID01_1444 [Nematocida sp. AWRm77]